MSIFKDLHDAAVIAHQAGDRELEQALDKANVLVGQTLRVLNAEMTNDAMQLAIAAWTHAMLLLRRKSKRAA